MLLVLNIGGMLFDALRRSRMPHQLRDIKLNNPALPELAQWHELCGLPLRRFFNTSGLLYRSSDLKNKLPEMSDEEMPGLLATDGMLVKRPLMIGDDFVLVGFRQAEWEEKIAKNTLN